MHRSFLQLFPSGPCRDWFQFDAYEYRYFPPAPYIRNGDASWHAKFSIFYRKPPETACWFVFSNQPESRWSKERTPWFLLYCPHNSFFFEVDDVYCGADFVMVQIADKTWPRWMVIWIHHGKGRCSRYGRLMRRPTLAYFRATSRANSKPQPWLNSVLDLAAS